MRCWSPEGRRLSPDCPHHCGGSCCTGEVLGLLQVADPPQPPPVALSPPPNTPGLATVSKEQDPAPRCLETEPRDASLGVWGWRPGSAGSGLQGRQQGQHRPGPLPGWNASSDRPIRLPGPKHPGPSSQLKGDLGAACPVDSATPGPSTRRQLKARLF